jgi:hypothetical protein
MGSRGPYRTPGGVRGVPALLLAPPSALTERQLAARASLSERIASPAGGSSEKGPE